MSVINGQFFVVLNYNFLSIFLFYLYVHILIEF